MSIFSDMRNMHEKFGVIEWVEKNGNDPKLLKKFLSFRIAKMMDEEMNELRGAAFVDDNPAEIVDALIDLIVFATSILDAFDVDGQKAWDLVYNANMTKSPGVKAGRPNQFGLPDMIKPDNFVSPDHSDNVGRLNDIY